MGGHPKLVLCPPAYALRTNPRHPLLSGAPLAMQCPACHLPLPLPLPLPSAGTIGSPAWAFAQCSNCSPGDEVEVVLCYPPGTPLGSAGVTRGSIEFISERADALGQAAPAFASLSAMRAAADQGSRYFYNATAGLLFLRLRQAAGWGGAEPAGYCPPGGCAAIAVNAGVSSAATTAEQCESRLAASPGGAPSDAATDAYLAAALPAPLFDLKTACPSLPPFGCDCWGFAGCANRECSAAERSMTCDAGTAGNPLPPPPPAAGSPPLLPPTTQTPPPQPASTSPPPPVRSPPPQSPPR